MGISVFIQATTDEVLRLRGPAIKNTKDDYSSSSASNMDPSVI
jgi:hypothetical protein